MVLSYSYVDTVYMGSPLFDENTGKTISYRYDYLTARFPEKPWMNNMNFTCDEDYPRCRTNYPLEIGDGKCDEKWNYQSCGFDGGDCL